MELHELADRIFRLHAKLIIFFLLAGVLGGIALHQTEKPQYQASAQLVTGASDPQSAQNAAVLADTARAIATGPRVVAKAISQAGVTRDETTVAAGVNVQTLGSSGVVSLSATDPDPRVAVALANSLASSVVSTRATLARAGLISSLAALNQQEALVRAQIRHVSAQADALSAQLAYSPSTAQAPTIAQLTALETRLTSLQDQATQIALQRNQLSAQQGPAAAVLDTATSAVRTGGRGLIIPVLGALLGLVIGIAAAAAREMARPSLVGGAAISKAIGTPLLGEMSTPPDSWTLGALPDAGTYVELAADSQQVREVRFAAIDPNGRRRARVRMLEGPLHRLQFSRLRAARQRTEAAGDGHTAEARTGLVVAVPRILKVADIDAVTNFIWISGWTLLGVIVYPAKRGAVAAARRGSRSEGPPRDDSVTQDVEVEA